jgi:hypothetical protein
LNSSYDWAWVYFGGKMKPPKSRSTVFTFGLAWMLCASTGFFLESLGAVPWVVHFISMMVAAITVAGCYLAWEVKWSAIKNLLKTRSKVTRGS